MCSSTFLKNFVSRMSRFVLGFSIEAFNSSGQVRIVVTSYPSPAKAGKATLPKGAVRYSDCGFFGRENPFIMWFHLEVNKSKRLCK